jgi:hypothetical protein
VCETWFSPGMAGVDTAGLGEVIQNVLARFPDSEKGRLVKVCRLIGLTSEILLNSFRAIACLECVSNWIALQTSRTHSTSPFDVASNSFP